MRAETSSRTSMRVTWSLLETNPYDSQGIFSVYFLFGGYEVLAGTSKDYFFDILGLVYSVDYTVRVELQYPHSSFITSATTHHLLSLVKTPIPPR